jgi:hypothetical protein
MDKSLFLMIGALTSNPHQDHSGKPMRRHHSLASPEQNFVEGVVYLSYQESFA